MALLLEFSDYLDAGREKHRDSVFGQRTAKFDARVIDLIRSLEMIDLNPILESQHSKDSSFSISFTLKAQQGNSIFYRLRFDQKRREAQLRINILQRGSYCCLRSSQIIKNICRTMRSINSMASKCLTFFTVSPTNRQILIKTHSAPMQTDTLFPYLKLLITDSGHLVKSFSPILLYSANLISRSSLDTQLIPSLRNLFFGPQGDFNRYAEIYELLPLINCPLEIQTQPTTQMEIQDNQEKNSNPKRIIKLLYDQKNNTDKKEISLYSQPDTYNPETPISTFKKDAFALNYPTPKQIPGDHPFIFNTITVTAHDKKKDRYFKEGGKARIFASPTKFVYAKSMNVSSHQASIYGKKDMDDDESTEETDDVENRVENTVEMDKILLVKMPRANPRDHQWKKLLDQITYQKEILSNLRTVGCAYIPKYYHSVQEKYEYRSNLLMDYVPGSTLAEEMQKKQESLTHSAKLHILTHLSNAIRFLNDHSIAHLDLSPNNIMVVKDFLVKIIDFGEAYHNNTSRKYSPSARGAYGKFIYAPGRTFPYAPPETSSRLENFSSQQDMYSLGVIMHQLVFGTFPFVCSQETHKKLYLEKSYNERMMLAPERAQSYGQFDFIAVLINLILKLLDCDEKRRPYPVWAHIIIKKLFYAIR